MKLISRKGIQDMLGMSKNTVSKLLAIEGAPKPFRMPTGAVRYDSKEVETWIASMRDAGEESDNG